jgi:hypothetical protein
MDHKNYLLAAGLFLFSGISLAQNTANVTQVEMTLNFSQILLSILAIGGISYSAYLLRGGRLAKPMAVIGVGLTIFAFERLWQGIAKLGFMQPMDSLTVSLIYQLAGIMIAGGYIYVAFVLKN